ncbi:iron chelate uptake ABC transporter family permease subunit, partial [Neisseria sicca]
MVNMFRRPLPPLAVLLLLLCALTAWWIFKLEWTLPWLRIFDRPDTLPLDALMVQNNTLPRMAMALLAGGSTAAATMLMQQLMRNPLASDGTLAVSSGAQTALVAATVFAPSFLSYGTSAVAFAGAAAALGAVLWLSSRRGLQPLTVVLAGLVVSLYLGSLTGIVMLFFSEETRGVMQWGSG